MKIINIFLTNVNKKWMKIKNIMKGYQCCNKVAANFQKKSRNGNEKKYLREFDGQVLEQNVETGTTFFRNWQ